jgi:hypothetical protein
VAQRKVLEGDIRRLEEQGAEEGQRPITKIIGAPRHQACHLSRDSTGSAVEVVSEVQAGQADGLLDRDRMVGAARSDSERRDHSTGCAGRRPHSHVELVGRLTAGRAGASQTAPRDPTVGRTPISTLTSVTSGITRTHSNSPAGWRPTLPVRSSPSAHRRGRDAAPARLARYSVLATLHRKQHLNFLTSLMPRYRRERVAFSIDEEDLPAVDAALRLHLDLASALRARANRRSRRPSRARSSRRHRGVRC